MTNKLECSADRVIEPLSSWFTSNFLLGLLGQFNNAKKIIRGLSVGETLTQSLPEHAFAVLNWLD